MAKIQAIRTLMVALAIGVIVVSGGFAEGMCNVAEYLARMALMVSAIYMLSEKEKRLTRAFKAKRKAVQISRQHSFSRG